jgi:hypothetical protein
VGTSGAFENKKSRPEGRPVERTFPVLHFGFDAGNTVPVLFRGLLVVPSKDKPVVKREGLQHHVEAVAVAMRIRDADIKPERFASAALDDTVNAVHRLLIVRHFSSPLMAV